MSESSDRAPFDKWDKQLEEWYENSADKPHVFESLRVGMIDHTVPPDRMSPNIANRQVYPIVLQMALSQLETLSFSTKLAYPVAVGFNLQDENKSIPRQTAEIVAKIGFDPRTQTGKKYLMSAQRNVTAIVKRDTGVDVKPTSDDYCSEFEAVYNAVEYGQSMCDISDKDWETRFIVKGFEGGPDTYASESVPKPVVSDTKSAHRQRSFDTPCSHEAKKSKYESSSDVHSDSSPLKSVELRAWNLIKEHVKDIAANHQEWMTAVRVYYKIFTGDHSVSYCSLASLICLQAFFDVFVTEYCADQPADIVAFLKNWTWVKFGRDVEREFPPLLRLYALLDVHQYVLLGQHPDIFMFLAVFRKLPLNDLAMIGIHGLNDNVKGALEMFSALYCVPADVRDICNCKLLINFDEEREHLYSQEAFLSTRIDMIPVSESYSRLLSAIEGETARRSTSSSSQAVPPTSTISSDVASTSSSIPISTPATLIPPSDAPKPVPKPVPKTFPKPADPKPVPKKPPSKLCSCAPNCFVPNKLECTEFRGMVKLIISGQKQIETSISVGKNTTVQELGNHCSWCIQSQYGKPLKSAKLSFTAANCSMSDTNQTLSDLHLIGSRINVTVHELNYDVPAAAAGDDDDDDADEKFDDID